MTIPTSSIEQVIPGQGSMAQPEDKPAKRRRFLFLRNPKALTGLIVLGIYILIGIIGPWIAPYDPDARSNALVAGRRPSTGWAPPTSGRTSSASCCPAPAASST